jgi:hypothetical protein
MALHRRMSLARRLAVTSILAIFLSLAVGGAHAQTAASTGARPIGTIKTISGRSIVLASDAGPVFNILVEDGAKVLRIEPGAKDLKNASPITLQDLLAGDRILVLGKISAEGDSVNATTVIAMKKADVASKQEHDRQEWQRHAVGGLVSAVDPGSQTITISLQSFAGPKTVAVQVSKDTIVRRYAPDSVKFDDAKLSSLDDIKPGDQVRARGTRSADGTALAADEIVSGAFQNIAGIISSVDASTNTLTISDLISKKPVTVKVTSESQLRKLPPQMAQLMAMRLKGPAANPANGTGATPPAAAQSSNGAPSGGGARGGGGGDMQQILSRVPPASLSDVQKGDAVMIVSTEGTVSGSATVITLVAGVEPILQASPAGGQAMILPPWSLDAPAGDAAQ